MAQSPPMHDLSIAQLRAIASDPIETAEFREAARRELLSRPPVDGPHVRQATSGEHVVLTGIDIRFGELVTFLVKVAFASIPAAIIVTTVVAVSLAVVSGIVRGL